MSETSSTITVVIDTIAQAIWDLRQVSKGYEKEWVLYIHPHYYHRMLKEATIIQIRSLGFNNQERHIMGMEYVESEYVPEFPGWIILPRPKGLT